LFLSSASGICSKFR